MLHTIVPRGPWTFPLNWDLYAADYGDTYIPFAQHARLEPADHPNSTFTFFPSLPVELQLHIISFCDSATLFWLMQVCSALRSEASKLFWSDPSVWYTIDGAWILAGGFPGHTHNTVDALRYMQQVIVHFSSPCPLEADPWDDGLWDNAGDYTEDDVERRIHDIWQEIQRQFPCATHVVLSNNHGCPPGALLPLDLRRMAEACPPNLSVYASWLDNEKGTRFCLKRCLWRYVHDDHNLAAAEWKDVLVRRGPQHSVLPPLKKFDGPAGAYSRHKYLKHCSEYQHKARRILVLHAVEAFFFQQKDVEFMCPTPECGTVFPTQGQWMSHAIQEGHDVNLVLPDGHLDTLFAQHDERLVQLDRSIDDTMEAMRTAWGVEGSEQRRHAEHDFLSQLKQDPRYRHQRPAEQCTMWRRYQCDMEGEVFFDWNTSVSSLT
ncbi:hypothetical protein CC86DRAFT_322192 [Ophiobolus disseminans]|uniref:C2H2-type domain-containing protein n=1 Tax=Ophiobolus disseminans TaxID=1469910 RepID=A0A6A7A0M1_9PLEO|nr:hypothetical protein CC86DRAFT_322192 [Ophiobolus disseminans]